MSWTATVIGGMAGVWNTVQALVKAGLSTGAIQAIAGMFAAMVGTCKQVSAQKNVSIAMANLIEYEPGDDNVDNLTAAIARLSYVLEIELKAKKEREENAKKLAE